MQIQNDIIHIKLVKGVIGMDEKILQAIEGLKNGVDQKFEALSSQFGNLSNKVDNLSDQFGNLTSQFGNLSSQVQENTQILKALEHLAQVNKAEHDKMSFDIAEISGEIKTIRKDLSTVELVTASNWGDIVKLKSVK